jgi:CDGSH-type Zn-finger protein
MVEFKITPNGPIHAVGSFTIVNAGGKRIEITDETYFCRCGASKDKPFCDGSHRSHRF